MLNKEYVTLSCNGLIVQFGTCYEFYTVQLVYIWYAWFLGSCMNQNVYCIGKPGILSTFLIHHVTLNKNLWFCEVSHDKNFYDDLVINSFQLCTMIQLCFLVMCFKNSNFHKISHMHSTFDTNTDVYIICLHFFILYQVQRIKTIMKDYSLLKSCRFIWL